MGKLYLVPTPIGNLGDITIRALDILKTVDIILAEDTRKSSILLKHYSIIGKPLWSHHKFNEHGSVDKLSQMITEGKTIALVSDAGTPAISDPGFLLVRSCLEKGIEVESLPGATALIPALVESGLSSDRFCFEGFIPQKKGKTKKLQSMAEESRTMIFYESPYRLTASLKLMQDIFGAERKAAVSRELTKIHGETIRGSISELLIHFEARPPKGEIVITVAGKGRNP